MTVKLFEIKQAVHTALKKIGNTDVTKCHSKANTAGPVHEYLLASEMRANVNKRYDNARKELLKFYDAEIEDTEAGDSITLYTNGIMQLDASKAKPRKSLDKVMLRANILDNFECTMEEVDDLLDASMKEAKSAVTLKVDIPD